MKKISLYSYFYGISSAVLFGASMPAAKYLLGTIDPWLLAGLLYLGAGFGLLIILFTRYFLVNKISVEAKLTYQDFGWLAGATLFGGIIGPVFLMFGLLKVNAATSSLLLNLESVFTAFIAWFVIKEHTNKRLIFGMVLIAIGGVTLAWNNHFTLNNLSGVFFITAACLAWAIDNNLTRHISAADPLKIATIKSIFAGVTNFLLAVIFGATVSNKIGVFTLSAVVGFLGYGLSLIFFILSLRFIGTSRTSASFSLAPFIGAALSITFLGDKVSAQLIAGGILMGLGIILHLTEQHEHAHQHDPLIHNHKHSHDEHHQHMHQSTDPTGEPHAHLHEHLPLIHSHPHYPDIHHRHKH